MQTTLRVLSFIGKIAGLVAALNAIPFVSPSTGVIIFFVASLLKDTVNRVGDFLDDGLENHSFLPVIGALLICGAAFGLVGCGGSGASVSSGADTAPTSSATVDGWKKFLHTIKVAALDVTHVGLTGLQTAAKACWTITDNLTPDQFAAYLKTFGLDAATIADAKDAYIQAGASAHAAEKVAATIDGATVVIQAAQ